MYFGNMKEMDVALRHGDVRTGFIHSGADMMKYHRKYMQQIINHYAKRGETPPCTRIGSGIYVGSTME